MPREGKKRRLVTVQIGVLQSLTGGEPVSLWRLVEDAASHVEDVLVATARVLRALRADVLRDERVIAGAGDFESAIFELCAFSQTTICTRELDSRKNRVHCYACVNQKTIN